MDRVRRQVITDLFAAPSTVLPITAGATGLLVSWALGSETGMLIGALGIGVGIGLTVTRWILSLDKITRKAQQRLLDQEREKHREELKLLEASLVLDGDPRTESCLRQLCDHYEVFQEKVSDGELTAAGYEVTNRVEQLFQACIDQLRRSHELWEQAHEYDGNTKHRILGDREQLVQEVAATTNHINSAVEHFRRLNDRRDDTDLHQLREELDESLRVARLVDERMAGWESSTGRHLSEFE